MWGPGHARAQQSVNQAHGRDGQLPTRRGRLGLLLPAVTVLLAGAAVVVYLLAV